MKKLTVKGFVRGDNPECPIPPHYKHTKVQGLGVKKSYCLWCRKVLK